MGDFGGALAILQDVSQGQPQRAEVWLNLATGYLGIRQPGPARQAFEQALDADPAHFETYVQLLALLVREGDLPAAEALLDQVRVNRPADGEYFEDLYRRLVERAEGGPGGDSEPSSAGACRKRRGGDPAPQFQARFDYLSGRPSTEPPGVFQQ